MYRRNLYHCWRGATIDEKKFFVLDTNVLLQDPNAMFSFEENDVIIPAIVLEEIDSKKRNADEIGRNARHVSRLLDELREKKARCTTELNSTTEEC